MTGSQQPDGSCHNVDFIGRPIHFIDGQFKGQTVRTELHEIQKADLGRKYAKVDRRPLDPPPVVLLRLYHVETDRQTEKEVCNYDEVQSLGLVCTVDLFPAPGPETTRKNSKDGRPPKSAYSLPNPTPYSSSQSAISRQQTFTFIPPTSYSGKSLQSPITATPLHAPTHGYLPSSGATPDIVSHVGDYPIRESSKQTHALVGATFVQPSSVDYQGKKSLMFVFADLAVKVEGTFILRYRVFDIFSKAYGIPDLAIQAECYGGAFRVYSTKEFPGLQVSTELTKQLARWGVRLNIRESERKRRKKGEMRSVSPPFTKGKGKENGDGSDDD